MLRVYSCRMMCYIDLNILVFRWSHVKWRFTAAKLKSYFYLKSTSQVSSKTIFCTRNKTELKLLKVLHPEVCREQKSRKQCRCVQHIVLSLSALCPGSRQTRLGCVLMSISQSLSGGSAFATHFFTGAPSAACCLSVCLALPNPIQKWVPKQSDRKTLTRTLRGWICESNFPPLLPCILVNRFWRWTCWVTSSSLCKAAASQGENKQRYRGVKMMTRLY